MRYSQQAGPVLVLTLLLIGCNATAVQPTPTLWIPPTLPPTVAAPSTVPTVTAAPTIELLPTATATVAGVIPTAAPETMIAIRNILASRSVDQEKVNATLAQLMSQPVAGGEAILFHWEDKTGTVQVTCTGYSVVQHLTDGTVEVQGMAAGCADQPVSAPMTIYAGSGTNINGEAITVVFGEILDTKIVNVQALFNNAQFSATINGTGYLMELPPVDVSTAVVTGYDAGGGAVFTGSPSLSQ